jgi:SAM-dependent methyltransferase
MPDAVARFTGFAAEYDTARPAPPADLVEVLRQWARAAQPDVVDLGAGTGLSTMIWAGRARAVTAVEPSPDMRAVVAAKAEAAPAAPDGDRRESRFRVVAGTAENTGLPAESADIITASQAMHWFDAARALPEIARVLRPGGVFAAFDYDFPPCVDWAADAAYTEFDQRMTELETARGLRPRHADKGGHLGVMRASGQFRYQAEIALHGRDRGDADRFVRLALSQGGAVGLLRAGASEREIGLSRLREVAARRLATPATWWWTYRVRLGVK